MITKTFTNQRDAINFANSRRGLLDIDVKNVARGQWVVTIEYKAVAWFEISEIEEACGVTLEAVHQMADVAFDTNEDGVRVVTFPWNTSAALCSATARFIMKTPAKFRRISLPSGMPVYEAA